MDGSSDDLTSSYLNFGSAGTSHTMAGMFPETNPQLQGNNPLMDMSTEHHIEEPVHDENLGQTLLQLQCALDLIVHRGAKYLKPTVTLDAANRVNTYFESNAPNSELARVADSVSKTFRALLNVGVRPSVINIPEAKKEIQQLGVFFEGTQGHIVTQPAIKRLRGSKLLSKALVFSNFGLSKKDAASAMQVSQATLMKYLHEDLKIVDWPCGNAGKKLLVQVRLKETGQDYAFDAEHGSDEQEVKSIIIRLLGLPQGNYTISYQRHGDPITVSSLETWIECKGYFKLLDCDRVYLVMEETLVV